MLDKIIYYSFGLLFFLTPFLWTPVNYELFEYNKMIFVYLVTIVISGSWILKSINDKRLTINRTPLDIPLLLFLVANILSTIFSIDQHTSIWGYYSRSNGGLLSIISYLLLYFALVSNITQKQVFKLLQMALLSGFLTSLYAISEHFGVSPSCVILRGELTADCWVQDVQARVFATLGQPNWLAAYLSMLIFPAIYFFLTAKTKKQLTTFVLSLITLYLAFTFTYSRGATLGLLAGLGVFGGLLLMSSSLSPANWIPAFAGMTKENSQFIKKIGFICIIFLLINIFFGSALTRFQISNLFPNQPQQEATSSPQLNQLENGGTESGQIRLIVWTGAIEIFKHYPLLGSGVETFAYSYYQFRPASHNLVSEWDFLYNKAHNEFLNYLATTGLVGFSTYMLIILTFIVWSVSKISNFQFLISNEFSILKFLKLKNFDLIKDLKLHTKFDFNQIRRIKNSETNGNETLLVVTILASYISYLVQNFFSFSVVIIAVFFYLFPALAFVATNAVKPWTFPKLFTSFIYHRPAYTKAIQIIIVLSTLYLLLSTFQIWYADTQFAKGNRFSDSGSPGKAYEALGLASAINRHEPLYKSELAFAAASSAEALGAEEATLSAELKADAITLTNQILSENPKNVSFFRTAIRTYFALSGIDPAYTQKTIDVVDQTIKLAPTDAKLYYNKAVILGEQKRIDEAIAVLQEAIELKSNYRDAYYGLALFQFEKGDKEAAKKTMAQVLQLIPGDPEAMEKLAEWGK